MGEQPILPSEYRVNLSSCLLFNAIPSAASLLQGVNQTSITVISATARHTELESSNLAGARQLLESKDSVANVRLHACMFNISAHLGYGLHYIPAYQALTSKGITRCTCAQHCTSYVCCVAAVHVSCATWSHHVKSKATECLAC